MVSLKLNNMSVYHAPINVKHAKARQIIAYLVVRLQTESNKVISVLVNQDFMI